VKVINAVPKNFEGSFSAEQSCSNLSMYSSVIFNSYDNSLFLAVNLSIFSCVCADDEDDDIIDSYNFLI